jgi:hypothetical protein
MQYWQSSRLLGETFVTSRRHMKKQMTLNELSAAINVEERARSSNKPSQQLQAHVIEKGGDRKF